MTFSGRSDRTDVTITRLSQWTDGMVFILNAGDYKSLRVPPDTPTFISANRPVLVAQLGSTQGTGTSMALVPAFSNWTNSYIVPYFEPQVHSTDTADGYENILNVMMLTADVNMLLIDDVIANDSDIHTSPAPVPRTAYSFLRLRLRPGSHVIGNEPGSDFLAVQ